MRPQESAQSEFPNGVVASLAELAAFADLSAAVQRLLLLGVTSACPIEVPESNLSCRLRDMPKQSLRVTEPAARRCSRRWRQDTTAPGACNCTPRLIALRRPASVSWMHSDRRALKVTMFLVDLSQGSEDFPVDPSTIIDL
jgi:hypothetical protein